MSRGGVEGIEVPDRDHPVWQRDIATITRHDVDAAYRLVAHAATSIPSPEQVADVLLATARRLTESDTAYLAVPVDDHTFAFYRTLGVQTREFRTLRVGPADGIGSLAREAGAPIRSIDYLRDERFSRAMREVTRREGIRSALAVPVLHDDDVAAVLYVANHNLLDYRVSDERVLAEYAEVINLTLGAEATAEEHRERGRVEERRLLARGLHDRVGRHLTRLMQITTQLAEPQASQGGTLDAQLSAAVAELAVTVRQEVDNLLSGTMPEESSVAALAAEICQVPRISEMRRDVRLLPRPGQSEYDPILPGEVAQALRSIGQEAVFNAELHSQGSYCAITIVCHADSWELIIDDDGVGMGSGDGAVGHFGIQLMRDAAQQVQADFEVADMAGSGVRVRCQVPVQP